jgi:hypothetical protein
VYVPWASCSLPVPAKDSANVTVAGAGALAFGMTAMLAGLNGGGLGKSLTANSLSQTGAKLLELELT